MRRSRFIEEQIIRVLNEGEAGDQIEELHRCHVINIKGRCYRVRDLEQLAQAGDIPQPQAGR